LICTFLCILKKFSLVITFDEKRMKINKIRRVLI